MNPKLLSLLVVLLLIILDQLSKWLASVYLLYAQPFELLPFFNLTLLHNTGAAFSLLADLGWQRWFLVAVSALASAVLFWLLFVNRPANSYQLWALLLILAGAVGNLIDRLLLGYVIDFISLHYSGYYFPAFNVADACISMGAAVWLFEAIFMRKPSSRR